MNRWIWGAIILLAVLTADRALLAMESRGYINYRRHGLNVSGARYHMTEMHTVFEPAVQQVLQVSNAAKSATTRTATPSAMTPTTSSTQPA